MQEGDSINLQKRLVFLRWWFLGGLALAILLVPTMLDITIPLLPLLATLILLALINLLSLLRVTEGVRPSSAGLARQLSLDLCGLGVLLFLTGGAANPLVSLLLFPVAVAALSLPGRWVAAITMLAVATYSLLMMFFLPLKIADMERASQLHLIGMWLTFVISAGMAAWFITRMTSSIRARDAALAEVREQALRDAQVVALGQLAAGAAHELGTPLATMRILAGELEQDVRLPDDMRDDVAMMRHQIMVCKDIIGGLVSRAGIERSGSANRVSVVEWLDRQITNWRTLWPRATCTMRVNTEGQPPFFVGEPTLDQALGNLLNNAARLAPENLIVNLSWDSDWLYIAVCDCGPGFPDKVLQCGGTEPLPAGEKGNGIGLWLTRTAVERMGGYLRLENAPAGAIATIVLPQSLNN